MKSGEDKNANNIENTAPQNNTIVNDQSADADTAEASTTGEAAQTEEQTVESEPGSENSDILVVYFSRTGEQYTVSVIDKGNTAIVAEMISDEDMEVLKNVDHIKDYGEHGFFPVFGGKM